MPGLRKALQGVRGLDGLAPEPRLLGHDEDLDRGARRQRVHLPGKSGPLVELGAADPVVPVCW